MPLRHPGELSVQNVSLELREGVGRLNYEDLNFTYIRGLLCSKNGQEIQNENQEVGREVQRKSGSPEKTGRNVLKKIEKGREYKK